MNPDVVSIIDNIEARKPLAADRPPSEFHASILTGNREIYRNCNERLAIDFSVDVLDFAGTQVFDPRVVRIAPGKNNELHRHAHESLFYVISGKAEVQIGEDVLALEAGGVAFVPRWAFHQSRNLSPTDDLVILAVTDFGLTKAVLGDYDKRTRLAVKGADVKEQV